MNRFYLSIGKRKIKTIDILLVIAFSIVYALAIKYVLPEVYSTGKDYEKHFSWLLLFLCIIDAIVLYTITVVTVSKDNYIQATVIRIVFWVYAIPMSLYPALFNPKYIWYFWIMFNVYWILFCYITPRINVEKLKLAEVRFPRIIKRLIGIASILILIYLLISQLKGFRFSLSLGDVYDIRQDFKEQMSSSFLGVFKTIFGSYVCPCLVVFFMKNKKVVQSAVFVFIELILFAMAKDKIMLLYLAIAIAIGFIPGRLFRDTRKCLNYAIVILSILNILSICGIFTELTFTYLTRRMFMMPAWGNYLWVEYFTDYNKLWLRQDVFLIDKFFSPVYPVAAPAVIASSIGGGSYSYFNTGLMGVSYSQLGLIGIILEPVIIGFWLGFINCFYRKKAHPIQLMLAFSIAMAIINSTTIETNNIVIFIAIAIYSGMFPNKDDCSNEAIE